MDGLDGAKGRLVAVGESWGCARREEGKNKGGGLGVKKFLIPIGGGSGGQTVLNERDFYC